MELSMKNVLRAIPALVVSGVAVASFAASDAPAAATTSVPFPAVLPMQHGLTEANVVRPLPWGTLIPTSQAKWVVLHSAKSPVEWGVWKQDGGPGEFAVRSTNGGLRWRAAGSMLATDWAGGSIFYIGRVMSFGASAVVMVSNAVIDVSTDAGHQWYQYVNGADTWSITQAPQSSGEIRIQVAPASYSTLPKSDHAIYRLDVARHRWLRVSQSVAKT